MRILYSGLYSGEGSGESKTNIKGPNKDRPHAQADSSKRKKKRMEERNTKKRTSCAPMKPEIYRRQRLETQALLAAYLFSDETRE